MEWPVIQAIPTRMQLEPVIKQQLSAKFAIGRLLGKGSFGNVYECLDLSDQQSYAVKIISKINTKASKLETLKEEAKLLIGLSHRNIVKFYEYGEFESCVYIKMELARGGSLHSLMAERRKAEIGFTDEEVAKLIRQLLSGLSYIHSLHIIHRDIKPENILICDRDLLEPIKIADFGLSTKLDFYYPKSAIAKCGTLIFMAPQILCKYSYTKAIDIWATAIITFMLFKGHHPLWTQKNMTTEQYTSLMAKTITFPPLEETPLAQDFFNRIAKVDPNERYSAQDCLKHPWITRKFADQIPLSVHESYSSFATANQIVKNIKFFMALRSLCTLHKEPIPDTYQTKVGSPPKDTTQLKMRKLKSLSLERGGLLKDMLLNGQQKPKIRITSEHDLESPAINKLNQIFNTLFDKKITSKVKLQARDSPEKQEALDIENFKLKVELQIQRSVKERLAGVAKSKPRRILPQGRSSKALPAEREDKPESSSSKSSYIRKSKKKRTLEKHFFHD